VCSLARGGAPSMEESRWVVGRMEVPPHRAHGVVGEKGEAIRDRFQAIHTEQEDVTGDLKLCRRPLLPHLAPSPPRLLLAALGAPATATRSFLA
jgi:hypothetical protein